MDAELERLARVVEGDDGQGGLAGELKRLDRKITWLFGVAIGAGVAGGHITAAAATEVLKMFGAQ